MRGKSGLLVALTCVLLLFSWETWAVAQALEPEEGIWNGVGAPWPYSKAKKAVKKVARNEMFTRVYLRRFVGQLQWTCPPK